MNLQLLQAKRTRNAYTSNRDRRTDAYHLAVSSGQIIYRPVAHRHRPTDQYCCIGELSPSWMAMGCGVLCRLDSDVMASDSLKDARRSRRFTVNRV